MTPTAPSPAGTTADQKQRYFGILENPYASMVQRGITDHGRVQRLAAALKPYPYESVLDVGCGLGENSAVRKRVYIGLDNSPGRVRFAARRHRDGIFFAGDGRRLPVRDGCVDLAMLIDTSHHLTDEEFRHALSELKRASRRFVVVSDPILTPDQSRLSAFFYRHDRGSCFRGIEGIRGVIAASGGLLIRETVFYRTFPGIYSRAITIMEKMQD